jgi:hypothetical protein
VLLLPVLTLDDPEICGQSQAYNLYWVDKKKTVLVIGRGSDNRQGFMECNVIVGAATSEASIIQLNFEAIHIGDCGVMLTVNQSLYSNFVDESNSVMVCLSS